MKVNKITNNSNTVSDRRLDANILNLIKEANKIFEFIKATKLSTHPMFSDSSILYNPQKNK